MHSRNLQLFIQTLIFLGLPDSFMGGRDVIAQTPFSQINSSHKVSVPVVQDPVYLAWSAHVEVRQCGLCHFSPGNEFARRNTDFCQLTEVRTWLEKDRHAISRQRIEPLTELQIQEHRQALQDKLQKQGMDGDNIPADWLGESNELSFAICEQLGYDLSTKTGYKQFQDNCLTCHAGYEPESPTSSPTADVNNRPGISCRYCHQIGNNDSWIDRHSGSDIDGWRLVKPLEKAQFGMRDLVDAGEQGTLCASCHIGNHQKQMFVTHRMYVAGHPPLPSFELQKFISALPPHWRNPTQTYASLAGYSGRDKYFAMNLIDPTQLAGHELDSTLWETRGLLVGAIVASKSMAALLAQSGDHWGDYALYDCSSCHHELKIPSIRQTRKFDGPPGRPRLPEWTNPLLQRAMQFAEAEAPLKAAQDRLHSTISETPFGNREACIPAARMLDEELTRVLASAQSLFVSADEGRKILVELCNTPADDLVDYHAARQILWAVHCIERELNTVGHPLSENERQMISQLGQSTGISVDLPETRVAPDPLRFFQRELEQIKHYDANAFANQLRAIHSSLQDAPK